MSSYIIAYHAGETPQSPEDATGQMAKWQTWLGELGDAVVNPGTPLGKSKFISSSGEISDNGSRPLTGYSVVTANSMNEALEMAQKCPFLEIGTLEVAQIKEMK